MVVRERLGWVVAAVTIAWMVAGCGSEVNVFGSGGSNAGGSGATTTTSVGGASSGSGGAGATPTAAGGDGGAGGSCALGCSEDLHDVIDCHGEVVLSCPAAQGCADGACIDACDAAHQSGTSLGCDFYSLLPPALSEVHGSCFAAVITNAWVSPVTITATWGSTSQNGSVIARIPSGQGANVSYQPLPSGQLGPGQTAVVFLSQFASGQNLQVPCPQGVPSLVSQDVMVAETGFGTAFHLATDRPVAAYDVFPYGLQNYAAGATLLLPVPSWGTNFVAVDAYDADPNLAAYNATPFLQLVATEDDTQVTLLPTAAIVGGGGVPANPQGQPVSYTLDAGQVLQLKQPARLVGSTLDSSAPLGLWGGSSCMNVPLGSAACDTSHQELAQVQALGHEHVGVQYRSRSGAEESVPYQLVGVVDGTELSWDPQPPGAPSTLQRGQKVGLSTALHFSVSSQDDDHPFHMANYMTGGSAFGQVGDPEMVPLVPPAQWLRRYTFAADPTYANTNLVVVRRRDADVGFADVTLDCAGILDGWQPIGAAGDYELTRIDLVENDLPSGGCANGTHLAESLVPFALTVWGFGQYQSYGYPAGMRVEPINNVVVLPTP